jgi:hypothetical protein
VSTAVPNGHFEIRINAYDNFKLAVTSRELATGVREVVLGKN